MIIGAKKYKKIKVTLRLGRFPTVHPVDAFSSARNLPLDTPLRVSGKNKYLI